MNEIEASFTVEFWLILVIVALFGVAFAAMLWLLRKYEFLPDDPGSSVIWVVVGVAVPVALSGFVNGWISVIRLALIFIAAGIPQGIYTVIAIVDAKRRKIAEPVK